MTNGKVEMMCRAHWDFVHRYVKPAALRSVIALAREILPEMRVRRDVSTELVDKILQGRETFMRLTDPESTE